MVLCDVLGVVEASVLLIKKGAAVHLFDQIIWLGVWFIHKDVPGMGGHCSRDLWRGNRYLRDDVEYPWEFRTIRVDDCAKAIEEGLFGGVHVCLKRMAPKGR